jgi:hypothetical protein
LFGKPAMQYIVAEQPCPMPDSRFAAHGWKKNFSLASQIVQIAKQCTLLH